MDDLLAKIGEGRDVWNRWRAEDSSADLNLSDVDLIGPILQGINFSKVNFDGDNLAEADCTDSVTAQVHPCEQSSTAELTQMAILSEGAW